jgi:hypothetical protein
MGVGIYRIYVRLTVTPEEILAGMLCSCDACWRDGQHEPDCPVHEEETGDCRCDREDQPTGAS